MRSLPTLRHELIAAMALVFAGALAVAALGLVVLLPLFQSPGQLAVYFTVLLAADVVIFTLFGRYMVERRVLAPLERLVVGAEAIAEGDYTRRLPTGEVMEISRVADAVNRMAEHLIWHQEQLAGNVRSLEETNRQLTEARDELVRAEKMASVGRLAAGIAHEVGNPLSALLGFIELMPRCSEQQRAELATAAEREARRIDRIVRGLLDFARPRESAAPRPIDVTSVVQDTLELLSTQGRFIEIALETDLSAEVPQVAADPHMLQQVIVNLILNAADALEGQPDPKVRVTTSTSVHWPRPHFPARRRDDPPDIDYSHRRRFHESARLPRPDPFAPGGRIVEIEVSDNGAGIPAALLPQVFEPFVTSKEPGKGTGLGLAVAARLIDAMGGTIRVQSEANAGATFRILLPALQEEHAEQSMAIANPGGA